MDYFLGLYDEGVLVGIVKKKPHDTLIYTFQVAIEEVSSSEKLETYLDSLMLRIKFSILDKLQELEVIEE